VAVDEVNRLRDEYGGERLTFDTIKVHYDGVLETGTAAVLDPYVTGPDEDGSQLLPGERVTELLVEMQGQDMNLHLHTVGDRAVRTVLDAVEAAREQVGGSLDSRVTVSHVEILDEGDVNRFAELDVVANFTPHWHGEYGEDPPSSEAFTGPERSEIKHRARLLHDAGAVVTYSSDVIDLSEVERANPYFGIQVGHTRQEPAGGADAPVTPPTDQALSMEQLIAGYTVNAAYQLGWEDRLGSIEVGKIADLVVLDQDLFEIDPYDIANTRPTAVVVDGEVVLGELTG
jgi:predicted amidohydrolase YtcJ